MLYTGRMPAGLPSGFAARLRRDVALRARVLGLLREPRTPKPPRLPSWRYKQLKRAENAEPAPQPQQDGSDA